MRSLVVRCAHTHVFDSRGRCRAAEGARESTDSGSVSLCFFSRATAAPLALVSRAAVGGAAIVSAVPFVAEVAWVRFRLVVVWP